MTHRLAALTLRRQARTNHVFELHKILGETSDPLGELLCGHLVFVEMPSEPCLREIPLSEAWRHVRLGLVGTQSPLHRSRPALELLEEFGRNRQLVTTCKGEDL